MMISLYTAGNGVEREIIYHNKIRDLKSDITSAYVKNVIK